VIVSDTPNYMKELQNYLKFLIKDYILEDEEMLTPYAKRLKKDIYDLFGEQR
jgi:hypothetical protein